MKTTRDFSPTDRYHFDFGACSIANGWAQFDTTHDASYYGQWLNPTRRMFFSYVEGDCTLVECVSDEEFIAHVRKTVAWHQENAGGKRPAIDPGFNPDLKAAFEALGLGDLLH